VRELLSNGMAVVARELDEGTTAMALFGCGRE